MDPATSTGAAELSVQQQLFSVEPTLEIDDLERYSQAGLLNGGFMQFGLPIFVLGLLVFVGFLASRRKMRLKCSKKECRETYIRYIALGVLNAMALFVVFELVGGLLRPASLQMLAIYVDEEQRFSQGDQVRAAFDIMNTGSVTAEGLQFRNEYSQELKLIEETILFTKDGALPEGYLPYTTSSQIFANIGDLEPGESVTISYDFIIKTNLDGDIANHASVSGDNTLEIISNIVHIRRSLEAEVHDIIE